MLQASIGILSRDCTPQESASIDDIEDIDDAAVGSLVVAIDWHKKMWRRYSGLNGSKVHVQFARPQLSITRFASFAWCERETIYNIQIGKPPRSAAMVAGSIRHDELEKQVHEVLPIETHTEADRWALHLVNTIFCIGELSQGRTREIPVFGVLDLPLSNSQEDPVPRRSASASSETASMAAGATGLSRPSASAPADSPKTIKSRVHHTKLLLFGIADELLLRRHPAGHASGPLAARSSSELSYGGPQECLVRDNKTRQRASMPSDAQKRTSMLQVDTYRMLLDGARQLAAGRATEHRRAGFRSSQQQQLRASSVHASAPYSKARTASIALPGSKRSRDGSSSESSIPEQKQTHHEAAGQQALEGLTWRPGEVASCEEPCDGESPKAKRRVDRATPIGKPHAGGREAPAPGRSLKQPSLVQVCTSSSQGHSRSGAGSDAQAKASIDASSSSIAASHDGSSKHGMRLRNPCIGLSSAYDSMEEFLAAIESLLEQQGADLDAPFSEQVERSVVGTTGPATDFHHQLAAHGAVQPPPVLPSTTGRDVVDLLGDTDDSDDHEEPVPVSRGAGESNDSDSSAVVSSSSSSSSSASAVDSGPDAVSTAEMVWTLRLLLRAAFHAYGRLPPLSRTCELQYEHQGTGKAIGTHEWRSVPGKVLAMGRRIARLLAGETQPRGPSEQQEWKCRGCAYLHLCGEASPFIRRHGPPPKGYDPLARETHSGVDFGRPQVTVRMEEDSVGSAGANAAVCAGVEPGNHEAAPGSASATVGGKLE